MISKRTRRATSAIEPLKQFEIKVSKGIDATKNADSPDTVLDAVNFDLTPSGDAELRKPIVRLNSFGCVGGEVLKVLPLYRSGYFLKITRLNDVVRAEIVDEDDVIQSYKLLWYDYYTEEEHSNAPTTDPMTFADWIDSEKGSDAKSVDTSTTTLILDVRVNLADTVFGTEGNETIYDPALYADTSTTFFPRTIQLYWSDVDVCWIVKVVTPNVNTLQSTDGGELGLDANMALDNPYAIRDTYNSSAPTVKNILPYEFSYLTPTGEVVVAPTALASNTIAHSESYEAPSGSIPNSLQDCIGSWDVHPVSGSNTSLSNTTYTVQVHLRPKNDFRIPNRIINKIEVPSTLALHIPVFANGFAYTPDSTRFPDACFSLYLVSLTGMSLSYISSSANGDITDIVATGTLSRRFIKCRSSIYWAPPFERYDFQDGYSGTGSDTDYMDPPSVYMLCEFLKQLLNNTTVQPEDSGSSRDWVRNNSYAGYDSQDDAGLALQKRLNRTLPSSYNDPIYTSHGTYTSNGFSIFTVGNYSDHNRCTAYTYGLPLYAATIPELSEAYTTVLHGHAGESTYNSTQFRLEYNKPNKPTVEFLKSVWNDSAYIEATQHSSLDSYYKWF